MCECPVFFTTALLANICCHDIAFLWATGRFARQPAPLGARRFGALRGRDRAVIRAVLELGIGQALRGENPGLRIRNRQLRHA